ncbi:hypothetical protein H6501_01585 [Candidatus Woesearchaeota archaeon]|nr:hypothetical protein [Candidatus Woesearchaeota archaeon]USN44791.1 MAG: hypothetical protein H6500_03030 [Candidatus Woesearchaeota archaeon]
MNIAKKIKKQIIEEASSHPEKYFPVKTLEEMGFKRQACTKCGCRFWSTQERKICGDTSCTGDYDFIGNTPAKVSMEFPEVYLKWREYIEKRGYLHVNRFPIVARWRDDLDFNIASVIGFQPYVTKGEVAPPAELVSIPQNCLRFGDVDNVGFTGRHGTGFTMIGQLAFKKPQEYEQAKYVKDLLEWFTEIVKIPKEELQIHEDAWVGGGDCGPSMEFFSRGLELANQVYMWFDMSDAQDIKDLKELKIKVLDMGMGQERVCWFSKGSLNQYEATMPQVIAHLKEQTKISPNWNLYNKFSKIAGVLNLDEVDDIEKAWEDVAKELDTNKETLQNEVDQIAGIYKIADHTRSLLYALTDGALPSNVKGGYNLRIILRVALDYIHKYNWDIDLFTCMQLHAKELAPLYPDLQNELGGIKKILDMEKVKYQNHKEKVENKIQQLLKKNKELSNDDFIELYISEGITPQEIKVSFEKVGKKLIVPANFFTLVTQRFEEQKQGQGQATEKNLLKEAVADLPPTQALYYENSYESKGQAKILKNFEIKGKRYVVLDKTLFYPTAGGQLHDKGKLGNWEVKDVIKVGKVIVHQVE